MCGALAKCAVCLEHVQGVWPFKKGQSNSKWLAWGV